MHPPFLTARCLALAATITLIACGKRGDPLPPLRPVPGQAQELVVRQVGNRIRLDWRAPSRNVDGTVEKLELKEVEVRRRIIDIPALVEEQTRVIEPRPTEEAEGSEETAPETEAASDEPEAAAAEVGEPSPETEAAPPPQTAPTAEAPPEPGTAALPVTPQRPAVPQVPVLEITNFAPDSRPVTTLTSMEPNAPMTFEEEIDPTWMGKRIEYAVVYVNLKNRRGRRSNVVQIDPVPPLGVPSSLSAEVGDGFVSLSWESPPMPEAESSDDAPDAAPEPAAPVDPLESGDPAEAAEALEPEGPTFFVFRRPEDGAKAERPLNPTPTESTFYEDRSVVFGRPTCYEVRTVIAPKPAAPPATPTEAAASLSEEDVARATEAVETAVGAVEQAVPELSEAVPELETDELLKEELPEGPVTLVPEVPALNNPVMILSDPSEEVCLEPVDTFAPPAPTNLAAVVSARNVLLTWSPVDRPDLGGYRVYRAEREEGPFAHMNDELLTQPSFTDDDAGPDQEYFYIVTAVDDSPELNESEPSELASVRTPPE